MLFYDLPCVVHSPLCTLLGATLAAFRNERNSVIVLGLPFHEKRLLRLLFYDVLFCKILDIFCPVFEIEKESILL
jgi:hypothetical protein